MEIGEMKDSHPRYLGAAQPRRWRSGQPNVAAQGGGWPRPFYLPPVLGTARHRVGVDPAAGWSGPSRGLEWARPRVGVGPAAG